MTGVSDAVRGAQGVKRSLPSACFGRRDAGYDPVGGMPVIDDSAFLQEPDVPALLPPPQQEQQKQQHHPAQHTWGLLVPVCCRTVATGPACLQRLLDFANSVSATVPPYELSSLRVIVGIDRGDVFYDCAETKERVRQLLEQHAGVRTVDFVILKPNMRCGDSVSSPRLVMLVGRPSLISKWRFLCRLDVVHLLPPSLTSHCTAAEIASLSSSSLDIGL